MAGFSDTDSDQPQESLSARLSRHIPSHMAPSHIKSHPTASAPPEESIAAPLVVTPLSHKQPGIHKAMQLHKPLAHDSCSPVLGAHLPDLTEWPHEALSKARGILVVVLLTVRFHDGSRCHRGEVVSRS